MKQKLALFSLVLAMVAAGFSSAQGQTDLDAAAAVPYFSTSNLIGTCGFTAVATQVNPSSTHYLAPDSWLGSITFNGAGKATAAITINQHGKVVNLNFTTGTYSVGADGRTGPIDFTSNTGGPLFKFVIVSNLTALRFINIGPTDSLTGIVDTVLTGVCKF